MLLGIAIDMTKQRNDGRSTEDSSTAIVRKYHNEEMKQNDVLRKTPLCGF